MFYSLGLNEDNDEFILLLCSEHGQNILIENRLSIDIESGNILYDNLNTNKKFYNFLQTQQDKTKKFIGKAI